MRRAGRLFKLVQILRSRRLHTGAQLAERLEVSLRTVYRDIRDLQLSGVPITGEAGVGFTLSQRIDIPPLMFSREELVALRFGLRVVQQSADAQLQQAAQSALEKLVGALPRDRRDSIRGVAMFASVRNHVQTEVGRLREAIEGRNKIRIEYRDEQGRASTRIAWPLGLTYWGTVWSLTAWCELRHDFRDFRLDRIATLALTDERYPIEPGRTLPDYWRTMESMYAMCLPAEWFDDEPAGH